MSLLESFTTWVQSFGVGGAFFIVTLCAFGICAMALWVVLIALRQRDKP